MSAVTFSPLAPKELIKQGFSMSQWLTNPSGSLSVTRLSRRARLARTLVVLSLAVVFAAGFAARSGAGDQKLAAVSYVSILVPAGATLWSVASAYSHGDTQGMIEQIREANNLAGYDLTAGARLRVPIK